MTVEEIKDKYAFDAAIVSRKNASSLSRKVGKKYMTPGAIEKSTNRAIENGFGGTKNYIKNTIKQNTDAGYSDLRSALKQYDFAKGNAKDGDLSNAVKASIDMTISAINAALEKARKTTKFIEMAMKGASS